LLDLSQDGDVDPLPISAKYLSLVDWICPSDDSNSTEAYVTCAELMLVRESSFIKLWDLCERLEREYWKYSLMRIISHEKKKNKNSERVVAKLKTVKSLQVEVSVAIAHLRGASIEFVESIQRWREAVNVYCINPSTVSLYYNNENYLLKMSKKINVFIVLRL
jgi:hypothetical protein